MTWVSIQPLFLISSTIPSSVRRICVLLDFYECFRSLYLAWFVHVDWKTDYFVD